MRIWLYAQRAAQAVVAVAFMVASHAASAGLVDQFAISLEQTVSNGVPGAGAGNLEEPAALDRYFFTAAAGTVVYFDELFASNCSLRWRCIAPDDSVVFDEHALCVTDPGEIVLEQEGEYLIEA